MKNLMRAACVSTASVVIATMLAAPAAANPLLPESISSLTDISDSDDTTGVAGENVTLADLGLAPGDDGLDDPFYDPPSDLPDAGQVIRTEPAQHLLELTGLSWPGQAEKILYSSTNELGEKVAASGFVIEPTSDWGGEGERPTVAVAPGTMGQGDQCAPSNQTGLFASFDMNDPSVGLNYEILNAYIASALGMRVVVTDYIGLGTPGVHTYVNSADEGNAVIDAARAALSHAGVPADSPVGFFGYSQGGGAAAAAAERVGSYAPNLNVKASYAGAPPADLKEVLPAIDNGLIAGTLGYALNSGLEYRPELSTLVTEHLNEDGVKFLKDTRGQCVVDSILTYPLADSSNFTKDGRSFAELINDVPGVSQYLDEQKLGAMAPNAPILVQNGVNDDAIPYGQAEQLARDYCAQGANVAFHASNIPEILPKSAIGHILPMLAELPASHSYMYAAFNDEELVNDCGSI